MQLACSQNVANKDDKLKSMIPNLCRNGFSAVCQYTLLEKAERICFSQNHNLGLLFTGEADRIQLFSLLWQVFALWYHYYLNPTPKAFKSASLVPSISAANDWMTTRHKPTIVKEIQKKGSSYCEIARSQLRILCDTSFLTFWTSNHA